MVTTIMLWMTSDDVDAAPLAMMIMMMLFIMMSSME